MLRALLRTFVSLVFVASLSMSSVGASTRHGPTIDGAPATPATMVPLAMLGPLGWDGIGQRVLRGVRGAVSAFRFSDADHDEVVAIAMERAWRAFRTNPEPIRNPEAWGRAIAEHASLDELRRQRRDRLDLTSEADGLDQQWQSAPGPLEQVEQAQRDELIRLRVAAWPSCERRLALLLMDGGAETVTEAARLFRAQAKDESTPMYAAKARNLLDARRGELEDLV